MDSYYVILMLSEALAFIMAASLAVIAHAYLNVPRRSIEYDVAYEKSEEEDERIQNVRLHQRHDS